MEDVLTVVLVAMVVWWWVRVPMTRVRRHQVRRHQMRSDVRIGLRMGMMGRKRGTRWRRVGRAWVETSGA